MNENKIVYTDISSPLGEMIAGATPKGICFLEWKDRGGVERILQRVHKRYQLPLIKNNRNVHLNLLQNELDSYFLGKLTDFSVTTDITGTPFEKKVWQHLGEIPYGKTCSYLRLADKVGKPKAARAVGRANGANYLAIVIPCHRVIASDGGLGGYGGKIHRKKFLLEMESNSKSRKLDLL